MDTRTAPSSVDRDRGLRRLTSLTLATTVAGIGAVAGFGTVAALSNPGHQATFTGTSPSAGASSSSIDTSSAAGTTATPAPATDLQPAAQVPVLVFGGGRTTTGGS